MSEIEIRRARPEEAPALGRTGAALARLHCRFDPRRFFARRGMEDGHAWWLAREMRNRKAVVLPAVGRPHGRDAESSR